MLYAQRIHFTLTTISNSFSLNKEPVLHIKAGDTVYTETIDALGRDKAGLKRRRGTAGSDQKTY